MKGNGLETDSLDGVIKDLEYVQRTWKNSVNQLEYPTLRDAILYLKEYRDLLQKPRSERLCDILREVRGEKNGMVQ